MKNFILIFTLFSVIMSGCKKSSTNNNNNNTGSLATACFTTDKSTTIVGDFITFTNCSVNGKTFVWDFGDGTQGTDSIHEFHAFDSARTYIVKLTVYDVNGRTNSTTKSITITAAPDPLALIPGNWAFIEQGQSINNPSVDTTFFYNATISVSSGIMTITNVGYYHRTVTTNSISSAGNLYNMEFNALVNTTYNVVQQGRSFDFNGNGAAGSTLHFSGNYQSNALPVYPIRYYDVTATKL